MSGRFLFYQFFPRFSAHLVAKSSFGLTLLGKSVIVRHIGMQKTFERNIEVRMIYRNSGNTCRGYRDPVIGFKAAYDFLFFWPTHDVIEVPDYFNRGI